MKARQGSRADSRRAIGFVVCSRALSALLALAALSCTRQRPASKEPYPEKLDRPRYFAASASGLARFEPAPTADEEAWPDPGEPAPGPAALTPNASVISADADRIAMLVNRFGPVFIESAADARAFRIAAHRSEFFVHRSTGGLWPYENDFLLQLYRDPFAAAPVGDLPEPSLPLIFVLKADGSLEALRPRGALAAAFEDGYELLSLLPARDRWLASLRKEAAARAAPLRLELAAPAGSETGDRETDRAAFEAALRPLALSGAAAKEGGRENPIAAALATAAGFFAPADCLIRLGEASTRDLWYCKGQAPAEAMQLFAWALPDGRLIALSRDGRAVLVSGDKARGFELELPDPGSAFTGLAALGDVAVAAWESGDSFSLRAAGILVFGLPSPSP